MKKLKTKALNKKQKLLKFLNSSLGIWLLSSVVLGGFTASFSYLESYFSEAKATASENGQFVSFFNV